MSGRPSGLSVNETPSNLFSILVVAKRREIASCSRLRMLTANVLLTIIDG